ncbi:GntR family transcriptional regulator [Actinomadura kijaniata]|uniref:GntR family transcriptional regulator n=1 Tax=Actinomadura kijaniata TaxID=46161 RepID=UPI003F196246
MAGRQPKYLEIARELQEQIDRNQLRPGDKLPTEKELAAAKGVSESTVKSAISELRKRGSVETIPKKGSFVAERTDPFVITLNNVDLGEGDGGRGAQGGEGVGGPTPPGVGGGEGRAFEAEARRQNRDAHSSVPKVDVRQATEKEARALGIPADESEPQVVCRFQERFVDGKPNSLQTSIFTLDLAIKARRLLEQRNIQEGSVAYLQQQHQLEQIGYIDEFDARPPTEEESRFFGLSRGSLAVIEHSRTAYDQNGKPFRLTVTVYRPGDNKIRFVAGDVPPQAITGRPPQDHGHDP